MPLCGGISGQDEAATPEIHNIVSQVKGEVHGKLNTTFDVFEAVAFRSQVVAGKNYFVKVHVGNENYVHLRIYKNLQQDVSLHSVQADKSKEDPLEYF